MPILLLANLFLGVYFNLSFWYKLTNKTYWGAYLTVFGALLTLVLNYLWIPVISYMGSAWATLICYASMAIASFIIGRKHYPVNYDFKRILGYLGLSLVLYFVSVLPPFHSGMVSVIFGNILVGVFILVALFFEKDSLKKLIPKFGTS